MYVNKNFNIHTSYLDILSLQKQYDAGLRILHRSK